MGHHVKKPIKPKQTTKEKLISIKKARKQKLKEKRARLVVRNLPFQSTEENLKEHFGKFGEIDDVQILKKEDGKLVGCGFIQFKLVQQAAKARYHTNGKPFLDRKISVDFAQAKDKYKETVKTEIKQEDEVKVKEETIEAEDDKKDKTESDDEEEQEDTDTDNVNEELEDVEEMPEEKKPRVESNDVTEGKTVFIKNVPFTATNEDLKECMRQFGPIYYALICVDKYTEHSKGTAFVKFQQKEDAEKALAAGTELTLLGNVLDCHRALGRNEIQQKKVMKEEEKTAPKDSRNLYLVKEGVILAGSKAAEGVSATDMAKRLQLEQYKTQILRNLNMFVSRERLIIHNLPSNWDDKKLRGLFQKYSPKSAIIKEARVMRDLKNVDANGVGRSKEFGFVSFNRHEDALAALRTLNNNPNIFSTNRRPILAFSIENKAMIKAKQKRLEKSRLKNPKCQEFDPNFVKTHEKKKKDVQVASEDPKGSFVGIAAKPGVQKMRSRYNLKTQAKLHHENLKKQKRKDKFAKKNLREKQKEFIKQPKQKINKKKKSNDNFGKLVTDYKKLLSSSHVNKKAKWYEQGN